MAGAALKLAPARGSRSEACVPYAQGPPARGELEAAQRRLTWAPTARQVPAHRVLDEGDDPGVAGV